MNKQNIFWKVAAVFVLVLLAIVSQVAFAATAATDAQSLGDVAGNIRESFGPVAQFMTGAFYLLGLGFLGSAIFKFRAHKDNPTQIPVGTPIALTFIGAAFLFTPSLFRTAGITLFGDEGAAVTAGVEGCTDFLGTGAAEDEVVCGAGDSGGGAVVE